MKTLCLNVILTLGLGLFLLGSGCAPVFSELQSARTAGKNEVELTAGFSSVSYNDEKEGGGNEWEHLQDHFGLQVAYGITDNFDLRLRYENLWVADEGGNVNVIGFGPKVEIVERWLAFYVPAGFAFGGDLEDDPMETWEIHPTVLFSIPLDNHFEINTSSKYIHELDEYGWRYVAFNLGLGLSTDLDRYVIRPEIGWGFDVESDWDANRQFSIGVTVYSDNRKAKEETKKLRFY